MSEPMNMDRAKALSKVADNIGKELSEMIADKSIDFNYASMVGVIGELHSRILQQAGETEEQRMSILMHWFQFHLGRIFPDDDIEMMIGGIEDLLDIPVDAEGRGKGN